VRTVRLVIECVRQFYSEARFFRILGENGDYRYVSFSNQSIAERPIGTLTDGTPICRRPIFDIDVRAVKKDPYTRLSHNETMKDLYRMGVFEPENAAQASILLSNMDLSGIGLLREQVEALAKAKHPASSDAAAASCPSDTKEEVKDPLLYAFEKAQQLREQAAEGAEP
jgi:hypothetical protein